MTDSVTVEDRARIYLNDMGEIPPNVPVFKDDQGYYYEFEIENSKGVTDKLRKLAGDYNLQIVRRLRTSEDEEGNGGELVKERRYVEDEDEVPEGYEAEEGPQGGTYYEPEGQDDHAPEESTGYNGEPVVALHWDDVEAGQRIAFEDSGSRDMGRVVDVCEEDDRYVEVESGDGVTRVEPAGFETDTEKAEGSDGGSDGADSGMPHNARHSPKDEDEDESMMPKSHREGPLEGDLYCEEHEASFEESECEDGECPFCGVEVSDELLTKDDDNDESDQTVTFQEFAEMREEQDPPEVEDSGLEEADEIDGSDSEGHAADPSDEEDEEGEDE